ncbi:RNA polymerase sigma factor [Kordiimonas sp.]|uniref:RNA polymerase sigma factor n=1 Tax=Kordiimonas sp. TaxID=1970157 RepID=UPI003A8DF1E2
MADKPHTLRGRTDAHESHTVRLAVSAVKAGDHQAFGALVALFDRRIFNLCVAVLKQPERAEEVAQDAFVKAYANIARYDLARPFYPWMATIAVRLAQTELRKRQREREQNEDYHAEQSLEPTLAGETPLSALMASEQATTVWRVVSALPAAQRTATYLFYRDDMTVAETALALGVTEGTVKTLLFRARAKLREQLSETSEEKETQ